MHACAEYTAVNLSLTISRTVKTWFPSLGQCTVVHKVKVPSQFFKALPANTTGNGAVMKAFILLETNSNESQAHVLFPSRYRTLGKPSSPFQLYSTASVFHLSIVWHICSCL